MLPDTRLLIAAERVRVRNYCFPLAFAQLVRCLSARVTTLCEVDLNGMKIRVMKTRPPPGVHFIPIGFLALILEQDALKPQLGDVDIQPGFR